MLNKHSRSSKRSLNYILIAQNDYGVRQWQISNRNAFSVLGLTIVLAAATLFFSADLLTKFVYNNKIHEMQNHYQGLTTTISDLRTQLRVLDQHINDIEARDEALRNYIDLPVIDADIRQLGIGGIHLSKSNFINETSPAMESVLNAVEMDVEQLSRSVRLELSSYSNIYDKMIQDAEKIGSIPSIRPIDSGYMTSGFGYRKDPFDSKIRFHYGQDFSSKTGSLVFATADGVVMETRYRGGFGKVVKISHGHGYVTYFGHLSEFNVTKGETIRRGQLIGKVGNTGRSTGPHLHYEVHYYNTPQNPLDYFFSGYLD